MINIDAGGREDAISQIQFYTNLKKESLFFSSVIVYAPYSIGSINSMLSGMYGNLNGVGGYYKAYNFDKKNVLTLTQYLKDAGYYTVMDFVIDEAIIDAGFDKTLFFGGKDEDKVMDLAKRHSELILRVKNKQPFFLFLDYNVIALNLGLHVIKKFDDFSKEYFQNKKKNFQNYKKWLEDSGKYAEEILNTLKRLDLYDDTLIVIYSDHGSSVGDKIGEKVYGSFLYDYTIKCWAYFIWKKLPKGKEINTLIRGIDIMPSILEILKIPVKDGYKPIQGKSFLPLIKGAEENRIAYSETGGLGGPTPSPEIHNVQSVRTNEWKLIYNKTNKKKELYYIKEDKEEKKNRIGEGLEIEKKIWDILQDINKEHYQINSRYKK